MATTMPTYSYRSRLKKTLSILTLVTLLIVALAGRSQAATFTFDNFLTGLQEVPPNASPAIGQITGTYNDVTNTFDFSLVFFGLLSPATAAHLHAPAPPGMNAPVAIGFVGFPAGVTSGSYANSYIFTASQETSLLSGFMYVNVHSDLFPGGEIRGQIILPVPEAETFVLLGLGMVGLVAFARRSSFPRTISGR